jgi:hypothetical protein
MLMKLNEKCHQALAGRYVGRKNVKNVHKPQRGDMLVAMNHDIEENTFNVFNISPRWGLTAFSYIFSTNISPLWGL